MMRCGTSFPFLERVFDDVKIGAISDALSATFASTRGDVNVENMMSLLDIGI